MNSVTFTPHQGLMALAEKVTRMIEQRTGVPLWDGEEGMQAVCKQKLDELGVSTEPIRLTPRLAAEQTGIVKRRKKRRALR